jgi:hypothetical protein
MTKSVLENDLHETGHETASHFALLAPVPEVHLKSAHQASLGRVAFGTNAFDTFDKVKNQLKGMPKGTKVDVYLYASHTDFNPVVSWHALYIGYVDHETDCIEYRPPSTQGNGENTPDTPFGMYWEVESLTLLDKPLPLSGLTGLGNKKPFGYRGKFFVPEGPILIKHP